ncbi:MAG: lysozyme inhibitor LprI family protein [Bdellovibrionaceae bacterium]|nr:lysozyme inhibitor LprI family protein [Pseudobdellovibrionaceae bacterium]
MKMWNRKMALALGVLGLVSILSGPTHAAEKKNQVQVLAQDCSLAETTAEINECLSKEVAAVRKELNQASRALLDAATKMDAESEGLTNAVSSAVRSHVSWIAYHEAHCEVAGTTMAGGSAQGMVIASCLIEKMRERTLELKALKKEISFE